MPAGRRCDQDEPGRGCGEREPQAGRMVIVTCVRSLHVWSSLTCPLLPDPVKLTSASEQYGGALLYNWFRLAYCWRHSRSPCARCRARSRTPDSSRLADLELPTLVVASHDEADPGHPYEAAERIAATVPGAQLISEQAGESPLAWQGGKLSRAIEAFAAERSGEA